MAERMSTGTDRRRVPWWQSVARIAVSGLVASTGVIAGFLAFTAAFDGVWSIALPAAAFGAAHVLGSWLIWPAAADIGLEDQ